MIWSSKYRMVYFQCVRLALHVSHKAYVGTVSSCTNHERLANVAGHHDDKRPAAPERIASFMQRSIWLRRNSFGGRDPVSLQISKRTGLHEHLQMHHSAQQPEANPGLHETQSPGGGIYLQVFMALGKHHIEVDDEGMDVVIAQGFDPERHLHKADMSH